MKTAWCLVCFLTAALTVTGAPAAVAQGIEVDWVEVAGRRTPCTLHLRPLYDPAMARVKG